MDNEALKALINKDMTIRIGDRVEVLRGPKSDDQTDNVWYMEDMERMQGKTYTVRDVWNDGRRITLLGGSWTWVPEWLRKVES